MLGVCQLQTDHNFYNYKLLQPQSSLTFNFFKIFFTSNFINFSFLKITLLRLPLTSNFATFQHVHFQKSIFRLLIQLQTSSSNLSSNIQFLLWTQIWLCLARLSLSLFTPFSESATKTVMHLYFCL